MSSAAQPSAYTSLPATASVKISIITNSTLGRVTGIFGQCFDSSGNVIPRLTFSGLGPMARETLGNVTTGCPVTFIWNEQSNLPNVVCTEFKLFFSDPSVAGKVSPFDASQFDITFSPPLTPGPPNPTLLNATIVNGNANWEYSGHVFTQIGTSSPVPLLFDPELEIDNIG